MVIYCGMSLKRCFLKKAWLVYFMMSKFLGYRKKYIKCKTFHKLRAQGKGGSSMHKDLFHISFFQISFFFFYLGFLSQPFMNYRSAGEGGEYFFYYPLYFHPLHRHLDVSRRLLQRAHLCT